ncbi:MAG: hypothetical protein JNM03_06405 [Sphingopyxis sp.]|uniref:hypothetical protein n=1 Tax=Sphingopyxis sp. TaxID=1908224 RepID=UPI001A472C0C|nr:hypothetical protein [Sphingopyxis sp.]MBL9069611.1 hypothetical protein [Sphingopyxis sp.]
MAWLQDNWIIAVVGLVVAVVLLWWLLGRKTPQEFETPVAPAAEPRKPLEAVKPEIIAAEPARFKPKEPAPAPVAATPPPAPTPKPVADAPPPPEPEPAPAPTSEPTPEPVADLPEEPTVPAAPVAETPPPATPEPAPQTEPAPAPEPAPTSESAIVVPEEPTAPPPAPEPVPAPAAKADNLQLLKGVGPKMVALLNGLGVTSFRQIADWTDADVAAIDPQLGAFQGRIARDAIVDQAGYLARGDKAGFEAKYGALGGEL